MGEGAAAARAEAVIARMTGVRAERDGSTIRITSDDGPRVLIDVLRELDADGLAPATLTVREPSLDDVFLALTGRHVEPDPSPNGRALTKAGVS